MKNYIKSDDAYRTIGEVTKELGLIDKKTFTDIVRPEKMINPTN